jgi:RNA polymerase sigma factor for flagellar operon FliA
LNEVVAARESAESNIADTERTAMAERVSCALKEVMAHLDAQDQLILALRLDDGRTVADIANTLRLDQKPLYRGIERLLHRLREGLTAAGCDAASVVDALER